MRKEARIRKQTRKACAGIPKGHPARGVLTGFMGDRNRQLLGLQKLLRLLCKAFSGDYGRTSKIASYGMVFQKKQSRITVRPTG